MGSWRRTISGLRRNFDPCKDKKLIVIVKEKDCNQYAKESLHFLILFWNRILDLAFEKMDII